MFFTKVEAITRSDCEFYACIRILKGNGLGGVRGVAHSSTSFRGPIQSTRIICLLVNGCKPMQFDISPLFVTIQLSVFVSSGLYLLEYFCRSVEPFVNAKELKNTTYLVNEFMKPGGIGEELQQSLLQRAKLRDNWVRENWQQVVLPMIIIC